MLIFLSYYLFTLKRKVSQIIDSFILETGLSKTLILKYVFNSKILNESMTIEEAGLKNKSEIIVYIKNPLDYIFINFQSINFDKIDSNKYIKIECLKTEKIETLLNRYKYKIDIIYKGEIEFFYNSKKIKDTDKSVEKFGLKNNSIIIAHFKFYYDNTC